MSAQHAREPPRLKQSLQRRLRSLDQSRTSFGGVVNTRCLRIAAVVVHNDATGAARRGQSRATGINSGKTTGDVQAHDASCSSTLSGSDAMIRDPDKKEIFGEHGVVKFGDGRRVGGASR
jgi:hypothetical protein